MGVEFYDSRGVRRHRGVETFRTHAAYGGGYQFDRSGGREGEENRRYILPRRW